MLELWRWLQNTKYMLRMLAIIGCMNDESETITYNYLAKKEKKRNHYIQFAIDGFLSFLFLVLSHSIVESDICVIQGRAKINNNIKAKYFYFNLLPFKES